MRFLGSQLEDRVPECENRECWQDLITLQVHNGARPDACYKCRAAGLIPPLFARKPGKKF